MTLGGVLFVLLALCATAAQAQPRLDVIGPEGTDIEACALGPLTRGPRPAISVRYRHSADSLEWLRHAAPGAVVILDLPQAIQAQAEGLLAPLEPARIPAMADLHPFARGPGLHWAGVWVTEVLIAHDRRAVPAPIQAWADLWAPTLRGRVRLAAPDSSLGLAAILAAARRSGAADGDIAPALAALSALEPTALGEVQLATTAAPLLLAGEYAVTLWPSSWAAQAGGDAVAAAPRHGGMGILTVAAMTPRVADRALAARVVATLLSPAAQRCLAERQALGPANRRVTLPPAIAARVPYGDRLQRLAFPPVDRLLRELPRWIEGWNATLPSG